MKTIRRRTLIAALAISWLAAGCSGNQAKTNSIDHVPVVIATASRADLQRIRSFHGTVEGVRQAAVYARIPEIVSKVHVREGEEVKAGQPLISFEESGPNSSVRQARALAEEARRNHEKYERLFAQGAVSELERNAQRTAWEIAQADFDAARDRALLTAPISGVVTTVNARAGRQAGTGEVLALVAALDSARVVLDVPAHDARELRRGMAVAVRPERDTAGLPDGEIDEVAASADPESRTVRVELLVPNPGHKLLPGMYVRADIEYDIHRQVISIPRDALVYRETGLAVFAVRDSVAALIPVTVGIESGTRVEILNGISIGEQVVVLGQHNLQNGTRVNPVSTMDASPPSTEEAAP